MVLVHDLMLIVRKVDAICRTMGIVKLGWLFSVRFASTSPKWVKIWTKFWVRQLGGPRYGQKPGSPELSYVNGGLNSGGSSPFRLVKILTCLSGLGFSK